MTAIRSYVRPSLIRQSILPPRRMTEREQRLNRLADKLPDTVLVWHWRDGQYTSFEVLAP